MDRQARVDLNVVTANVAALRERLRPGPGPGSGSGGGAIGGPQIMAVVKQDAYGHGAIMCARAALAGGATWLGVAHIPEALALRQAGLDAPILCLMAVPGEDHEQAIRAGVDLAAGSVAHLATLPDAARRAG